MNLDIAAITYYKYDLCLFIRSAMRAKPVSQKRSLDKRDRILNAMETLLRRKEFREISVAELARHANVSPATIYQRFSNVDATASVLLELYYSSVESWAMRPRRNKAGPETPLLVLLQHIAADAYRQVEELGHIMKPAYLYSRQHPDRVGPEWDRLKRAAFSGFESLLRARRSELTVNSLKDAAEFLAYFFNIMMLGPLLHEEEARWRGAKSRRKFSLTMATMAHRYLTT